MDAALSTHFSNQPKASPAMKPPVAPRCCREAVLTSHRDTSEPPISTCESFIPLHDLSLCMTSLPFPHLTEVGWWVQICSGRGQWNPAAPCMHPTLSTVPVQCVDMSQTEQCIHSRATSPLSAAQQVAGMHTFGTCPAPHLCTLRRHCCNPQRTFQFLTLLQKTSPFSFCFITS